MLLPTFILLAVLFFLCDAQEKAPLYMFSTSTDFNETFGIEAGD